MALVLKDRVQETTTTTGTGTITLAGAVAGYQSFSVIGNGNTTYYCVTSGTAWEIGIGTYTSAGTTLARTTILASSAAGAAITLAGTSNVFCVYPAGKSVYQDASGNVSGYNLTAGTVNSTPIGATSASTGAFTTLNANKVFAGSTSTAPTALVHLAAGTATAGTAPLKLTTGTNLTAIEAGVVEYNGSIVTATPNSSFGRSTVSLTNYTSGVGGSLTAGAETTSQLLLPTANDRITLPIGTYFLGLACTFTRGTVSTTSAAARLNFLGGGTAVGTFSGMSISSIVEGGASSNFSFNAVNINANNILTAASTTVSGVYTITLRGVMKITTAGTIIPSYTLSANLASAGTATVPNVLYFQLQQMDSQSATVFGPAGTGWN